MALAITATACGFDLHARRIPNALTLGGAATALLYRLVTAGPPAAAMGLSGWALGLAIFLPFLLLRGLGAGDVKLMACLGAWLGSELVVHAALYAAIAGGVMAIVMALASGYLRSAVDNVYRLLLHFRVAGLRPHPEMTLEQGKGPRLPYALPIAAGTVMAMWLQQAL
ncbi:MAG: A24 family peptidase [Vicinamibacterales bacterium]